MTTSSTFKALANFAKRAFPVSFRRRKRLPWKTMNSLLNLGVEYNNSRLKELVLRISYWQRSKLVPTIRAYIERIYGSTKLGGFRIEGTGKSKREEKSKPRIPRLLNSFKLSL